MTNQFKKISLELTPDQVNGLRQLLAGTPEIVVKAATEKDLQVRPLTAAEISRVVPMTALERFVALDLTYQQNGGDISSKRMRRSLQRALTAPDDSADVYEQKLSSKQLRGLVHVVLTKDHISLVRDLLKEALSGTMSQGNANGALDLYDRVSELLNPADEPVEAPPTPMEG